MRKVIGLFNFRTRPLLATTATIVSITIVAGSLTAAYAFRKWSINAASCDSVRVEEEQQGPVVRVAQGSMRVVVLGDSWVAGQGLDDPLHEGWPAKVGAHLGWETRVDAVKMTGFINGGFCADQPFAARIKNVLSETPDLVIVAGGINDVDHSRPDIEAAASAVLGDLSGVKQVIVVGVASAPSKSPTKRDSVNAALHAAAVSAGRPFVPTANWKLSYMPDALHLTVAGYAQYAKLMGAALTSELTSSR